MKIKQKVFQYLNRNYGNVEIKSKNGVKGNSTFKNKSFKRKDIKRAIWIAQGKPEKDFVNKQGYYGTAIQEWEERGLLKNPKKNKYKITLAGRLYSTHPNKANKMYREIQKELNAKEKARQLEYSKQLEEKRKEEQKVNLFHSTKFLKLLVGKTITNVRYLQPCEIDNLGWYKSSLVVEFDDKTCLIPQMDDEGNDGGAMLYINHKTNKQEVIYTL